MNLADALVSMKSLSALKLGENFHNYHGAKIHFTNGICSVYYIYFYLFHSFVEDILAMIAKYILFLELEIAMRYTGYGLSEADDFYAAAKMSNSENDNLAI